MSLREASGAAALGRVCAEKACKALQLSVKPRALGSQISVAVPSHLTASKLFTFPSFRALLRSCKHSFPSRLHFISSFIFLLFSITPSLGLYHLLWVQRCAKGPYGGQDLPGKLGAGKVPNPGDCHHHLYSMNNPTGIAFS